MGPMGPAPGPAWSDVLATWEPAWGVNVVLAVLAALYLVGAVRHGSWPVRRTASFLAALAAAAVTWNSGIAVFGHDAFAVHMVMHLMLIMVVPAFWVAAHPAGAAAPPPARRRRARVRRGRREPGRARRSRSPARSSSSTRWSSSSPISPGSCRQMAGSMALHHGEQALYLLTGLLFFHTAIGVDVLPHRPAYFVRFVLMLIAMGVDTLTGVVLMLAPATMFPAYDVEGVHLGGAIMWVGGDALMMVIMVLLGRLWVSDPSGRVDFGPWLESARRSSFSEQTGDTDAGEDLDEDDKALEAYNRMLARLHRDHG